MIESMSQRYRRPDWVRRLNAMGGSVGDARRIVPLDPDELFEQAVASLGGLPAGDFGDAAWRDRFTALVRGLDGEGFHVVGRLLTRQELLRSLRTRLLLHRAVERDTGIFDETIEAPVIVTGPARSGTSITFELLWLDDGLRAPLAWEALHPCPLPEDGTDRRTLWSECEQEVWADVQPEFAAVHELRSDLPVECVTLTQPSFNGQHWAMIATPEGWEIDPLGMYDFHRRTLQALQRGGPRKSWLLKTPGHLAMLELVFATYPDAWIVQTHRDPAKTMPSTVSTTALVRWLRSDDVDVELLSTVIHEVFSGALNRTVSLREGGTLPDRFVDVHFQDLMKDPVATLRAAYAKMERPFTDEHAERIRRYLAEKPKGKFGAHVYTPEEWGFTAEGLRAKLDPYVSHFGVALE
ncbi:MAG: sulfotransferase family protein [Myxococcota bacterium]